MWRPIGAARASSRERVAATWRGILPRIAKGRASDAVSGPTVAAPEQGQDARLQASLDDRAELHSDESKAHEGSEQVGQGQSLTAKLAAATQQLENGHKGPALSQLMAYIAHVEALVTGGVLTPGQGQALIDPVNLIIDSINATC